MVAPMRTVPFFCSSVSCARLELSGWLLGFLVKTQASAGDAATVLEMSLKNGFPA